MAKRSNAEHRRFLAAQKALHPNCPERLWDRYRVYIDCIWDMPDWHPKTFKEWVND